MGNLCWLYWRPEVDGQEQAFAVVNFAMASADKKERLLAKVRSKSRLKIETHGQ